MQKICFNFLSLIKRNGKMNPTSSKTKAFWRKQEPKKVPCFYAPCLSHFLIEYVITRPLENSCWIIIHFHHKCERHPLTRWKIFWLEIDEENTRLSYCNVLQCRILSERKCLYLAIKHTNGYNRISVRVTAE